MSVNAQSIGRVSLDLQLNQAQFQNQVAGIAGGVKNAFGSAFAGIGRIAAAAFSIRAMSNFVRQSLSLASDLTEVQNVVDVTFGKSAQKVNEWAQTTITSYGMSELSAKQFASSMGAILKSSNISGDIAEMSMNITSLAGDMASFYNMDYGEAFNKIRSGLMGMVVPMRGIGVDISKAAMEELMLAKGITKSYTAMSQAEKVMLRYELITNRLKDSSGDFIRTQGSWANQMRMLNEQWKLFMTNMGQGFLNIFIHVVKWLNVAVLKLQEFAKVFSFVTEVLFGKAMLGPVFGGSEEGAKDLTESIDGVSASTAKAGKAAKKALASFDQLNLLNFGSTAEEATPSVPANPLEDLLSGDLEGPVDEKLNSLRRRLESWKEDLKDFFSPLANLKLPELDFGPLKESWNNFVQSLKPFGPKFVDGIKWFYEEVLVPLSEWSINDFIPQFLDTTSASLDTLNAALELAQPLVDWLWENILKPDFSMKGNAIVLGLKITEDQLNVMTDALNTLKDAFDTGNWMLALSGLIQLFDSIFIQPFRTMWDELTKHMDKNKLSDAIERDKARWYAVGEWIKTKIFLPLIDSWDNLVKGTVEITNNAIRGLNKLLVAMGMKPIELVTYISRRDKASASQRAADAAGRSAVYNKPTTTATFFSKPMEAVTTFMREAAKKVEELFPKPTVKSTPSLYPKNADGTPFTGSGIPYFARGGIVSQPTLAMIGENHKREAVIPLEDTSFAQHIAEALASAVTSSISNQTGVGRNEKNDSGDLILKIGENEFARIAIKAINSAQRRSGKTLIVV